ncbi:hypothetical protein [Methanoregula sp.]|uniref:hypothetical protein n=1 Tax=Methanoregula sp. TaxID=2052170 RepID=UPI0035630F64
MVGIRCKGFPYGRAGNFFDNFSEKLLEFFCCGKKWEKTTGPGELFFIERSWELTLIFADAPGDLQNILLRRRGLVVPAKGRDTHPPVGGGE